MNRAASVGPIPHWWPATVPANASHQRDVKPQGSEAEPETYAHDEPPSLNVAVELSQVDESMSK
ncbi:MAG: hypothetical protein JWP75_3528 [Frondihabitans sp.]|nr:hypothetical protein [Frondihabitans sp.]